MKAYLNRKINHIKNKVKSFLINKNKNSVDTKVNVRRIKSDESELFPGAATNFIIDQNKGKFSSIRFDQVKQFYSYREAFFNSSGNMIYVKQEQISYH